MLGLQQTALGYSAAPHGFVTGLQDLPPDLDFQGVTWPHVNHTVGSSHKQRVINALLLTTVMMRSWGGQEKNEHEAPSSLSSPEGLHLFYGQRTTSAAGAVKVSIPSAKVTTNNRITLTNLIGKYSSIYN